MITLHRIEPVPVLVSDEGLRSISEEFSVSGGRLQAGDDTEGYNPTNGNTNRYRFE